MKAYVLKGIENLCYEDVEMPRLKDNEVLVEVMAAGICGSDIPRIFKTGTYHFPTIPGHEFSGIVRYVGKNCSEKIIGSRVGVFPLIPCMKCESCKNQKYELCESYNYLGSRTDGGFAEFVAVPERNIIKLPDNISFEEAAMLEPMNVALHALKQIDIESKSIKSAAVFGAGTIGILISQWLKYFGVENILVIGTRDNQKALLYDLGISDFCDTNKHDPVEWIRERTDNKSVDIVVECVGKNNTIAQSVNAVKAEGDIILVGNPEKDIVFDKGTYWRILRKQLKICGTWNSSFIPENADDWKFSVNALKDKKINLKKQITHTFGFNELMKGLIIMRDKTEFCNKIMLTRQ